MDNKKEEESFELPDLPPYEPSSMALPPPSPIHEMDSSSPIENQDESILKELADQEEIRARLPVFPDSPQNEGFSQSAIKEAINNVPPPHELPSLPEIPSYENDEEELSTDEMTEWDPSEIEPTQGSIADPTLSQLSQTIPSPPSELSTNNNKSSDIFVKIDRFHSVRRSLSDTQDKLEEISDILKKIRETKLREEQELTSWEKELLSIKSHIREVNDNIFEKTD